LLLRGEQVIIDQDLVTPEEMERVGPYAESLIPNGLRWFAAIGFWSGLALWGLTTQRTDQQGPFDHHDKLVLAQLSQRLTETATLSQAVGRAVLAGMTNVLELVNQPALALSRSGFVLDTNPAAEQVFDNDICVRNRRLVLHDKRAASALAAFIDQLRTTPDTAVLECPPIVVQRREKRPLILRILPVDGAARNPFLGARALLVFHDLDAKPLPDSTVIAHAFGLSPAETKLASLIAAGLSLERAAEELGLARETIRARLKAVFAKTGTHRQSELVSLLARVCCSPARASWLDGR